MRVRQGRVWGASAVLWTGKVTHRGLPSAVCYILLTHSWAQSPSLCPGTPAQLCLGSASQGPGQGKQLGRRPGEGSRHRLSVSEPHGPLTA